MSDYQRWEPLDDSTMRQSAEGGWVLIGDYSCLKREAYILGIEYQNLQSELARLKTELARLRASSFVTAVPVEQYERVVKAGDLLCFHYISLARKRWPDDPLPSSVTEWNAAKEGKPSA